MRYATRWVQFRSRDAGVDTPDGGGASSRRGTRLFRNLFLRIQPHHDLQVAHSGLQSGQGVEGFAFTARDWSSTLVDAAPGKASVCLGQRQRSTPVWFGFRSVDTGHDRQPDRAEVCRATGPYGGWRTALQAETYPAETS